MNLAHRVWFRDDVSNIDEDEDDDGSEDEDEDEDNEIRFKGLVLV